MGVFWAFKTLYSLRSFRSLLTEKAQPHGHVQEKPLNMLYDEIFFKYHCRLVNKMKIKFIQHSDYDRIYSIQFISEMYTSIKLAEHH